MVWWEVGWRIGGQGLLSRMGPPMDQLSCCKSGQLVFQLKRFELRCSSNALCFFSLRPLSDHPSYCPPPCPFVFLGPLSAHPLQSEAATWEPCYPIISQGSCSTKQAPETCSWENGVLRGGGEPAKAHRTFSGGQMMPN